MRSIFFLPPFFSQPACRCLQTTWRLTVICSRFPKPTIWARKRLTGLRSHVQVQDTTAVATRLVEAAMVWNTLTMIMMSLPTRTCGLRMSTAMGVDTLRPVTTGTMAALAATHPHHVIPMTQGPHGQARGTQKTLQFATIPQDDHRLQEDVGSQGREGITHQTTLEIRLGTTMASAPPDRGTHIGPHAANPSSQWTCKANHQVQTGAFYHWWRSLNQHCGCISEQHLLFHLGYIFVFIHVSFTDFACLCNHKVQDRSS